MDAQTPLGQRLKNGFASIFAATPPSSGRSVTPVTPGRPVPGKRGSNDMVHRLREQLKSREEMIMQMQTEILEQSRTMHIHRLRMNDLEELLRTANKALFQAEKEIDHLKKTLAESCTCRPASCQVRKRACLCSERSVTAGFTNVTTGFTSGRVTSGVNANGVSNGVSSGVSSVSVKEMRESQTQELSGLLSEARRLTEELRIIKEFRQARKSEDVAWLQTELAEARLAASRNAALFETCEAERVKLSCALSALQQKVQSQTQKLEKLRGNTTSSTGFPERSLQRYSLSEGGFESAVASGSLAEDAVGSSAEMGEVVSKIMANGCCWPERRSRSEVVSSAEFGHEVGSRGHNLGSLSHNLGSRSHELASQSHEDGSWMDDDVSRLSIDMENVMVADDKTMVGSSVQLGSPTMVGVASSGEASKGSFGGFVFDMDQENQVVVLNRGDETCYRKSRVPKMVTTAGLSPFSKMMTRLDLLRSSTAGMTLTDSVIVTETVERSIGSLDSAFDKVSRKAVSEADPTRCTGGTTGSSSSMSIVVDD